MASIGDLAVQLSLNSIAFSQGLNNAANEAKSFQQRLSGILAAGGAVATGAGAIGGLAGDSFAWVKKGVDDLAEVGRESKKLGLSTEQLSGLQFVMHGSTEAVSAAMTHLNAKLFEAAQGSKEVRDEFAKLYLDGKKLAALGTNGALEAISDKMRDLGDGTYNSGVAIGLLGKGGKELIPYLEKGSAALRDMEAQGGKLGAIVTDADVQKATQAQRAMDDLSKTMTALQRNLAVGIAPYITATASAMTDLNKQLDLKSVSGTSFDWLGDALKFSIAGFAELIKFSGNFLTGLENIGLKARAVFEAINNPFKPVDLQAQFSSFDFITDAQRKMGNAAVDSAAQAAYDAIEKIRNAGPVSNVAASRGLGNMIDPEMIKNALDLPASGLNIYQKYNNQLANLNHSFSEAQKGQTLFTDAVKDLGKTLQKNSFAEFAKDVEDAAGPLDKLRAKYEDINRNGLKSNPAAYASALSKEFMSLSPFQAAQHAPGALFQGSDAAHSASVAFERQGQRGSIQDQIKAGIDRMVESQKQTELLNKQIAKILDDRLSGSNPFK